MSAIRVVPHHRAVLADEVGPNWQWPHRPMAHFMLRSIETINALERQTPASCRALDREAHHHFRTADQRDGVVTDRNAARGISAGTTPDIAVPVGIGMIDRDLDVDVEPPAPLLQFVPVKHVVGIAAAEQE